ncbi:Glycylpeptide N-tetradecanoyltransferase 1 [Platanthera guangdongensis]|uniref:Glycylpeptide N-tetradecanoyltransferase n=1 Tax=Platanthera guangdongensis TaxID=2320717 RepID=A0ABR2M1S6_9ASPA
MSYRKYDHLPAKFCDDLRLTVVVVLNHRRHPVPNGAVCVSTCRDKPNDHGPKRLNPNSPLRSPSASPDQIVHSLIFPSAQQMSGGDEYSGFAGSSGDDQNPTPSVSNPSSEVAVDPPSIDGASIDAMAHKIQESLSLSKRHRFWETQPVSQFKDLGDTFIPEGPIDPPTPVTEVKKVPYNLPALYEWTTCDIQDDATAAEVYNLLSSNYVEDDENMFRFNYSKEFLCWALRPPGYFKSWHIGVRVKANKKLVAFITGVPAKIRVRTDVILMAEVNFLCVHKKLRSKRLAPVLIKEVTRRIHLEDIWQAAYTAGIVLPTPIATCQYWHRSLNPKKLIDVGFSRLGPRMTMSRTIRLFKLPSLPATPGFRKMELRDIPPVTRLLKEYLSKFAVAPFFDEMDVEHWLLPREDVVNSYLVESPENHEITDFCSFYTLPSSILNNSNHSTLKAAYSFYNISTKTPLQQLMNDALIVAKQKDYDVFNALDAMENESFLKELKFGPGDGMLHYYLYNYRLRYALLPSELGLVLL